MRRVATWAVGAIFVLTVGTAVGQDKPAESVKTAELDKKVASQIYETTKMGVELFNAGKPAECLRAYQGALTVLEGVLDYRPKTAAAIKDALAAAKTQSVSDAAFTLRKALDDAQSDVTGKKKALWDRLGGEPAVRAVVKDFVLAAAPDPKVNFFRDGKYKLDDAGVAKLQQLLVELISQVTGGPLKYTGRSMKESHKGMKITEAEFGALAGHLVDTLKKYKVPQAEIDELVGIVASTKGDIVEADAKPEKKALWDRLGGQKAVEAVVHDFVVAAAGDEKVNFFRNGKYKLDADGVKKLEKLLVELVSATTGGPLKYSGRGMKESHKGMAITEAEFNALAGHLVATLKKYDVPKAEIDELVAIVASTKDDIVEKK
jgi:hemoglobin